MQGTYVPPRLCRYTRDEAAAGYWKACADIGITPTVELVSILVAHGALETGHFQVGCWNNNPGNIKAGERYTGKYTCIVVNERLLNRHTGKHETRWFAPAGELTGNPKKGGVLKNPAAPLPVPPGHPQTRMRAFETLDDGLENKIRFLAAMQQKNIAGRTWPAVLELAMRGDTSGFIRGIRARSYFTASAEIPLNMQTPYEAEVCSLVRTYRPVVERIAQRVERGIVPPPAPILVAAAIDDPVDAEPFKYTPFDDDDGNGGVA